MTHLRKMMPETPYPKKTRHLPIILSSEEVAHLQGFLIVRAYRFLTLTQ
jgi:hypothetical protein